MNTKKHVNEIAGFAEAYEEVYEAVRLPQKGNQFDNLFVLMRAHVVVDAFEEKYNVTLLNVGDINISAVGDMVFSFDTVDFKTEENMTMCLLKWS
jgi:hypothetical protein